MNKKRAIAGFLAIILCMGLSACKKNKQDGEGNGSETTPSSTEAVTTTVYSPVIIEEEPQYEFWFTSRTTFDIYENLVGEIAIPAVDINYLVVQSEDNEYYLHRDVWQEDSDSGAIFGDYRNNFEYLDENNVIYGHNMADGSMFAKLLELRDFQFENDEDYFIHFNSKNYDNIFKICSVYEIDLTSFNYIKTGGFSDVDKLTYMENVRTRNENALLKPDEVPDNAKLITLSTCTGGGTKRFVVQGYLIARRAY